MPAKKKKTKVIKQRYIYTMPGDTQKVTLRAWAVGSISALEDYPLIISSQRELEALARMSLAATKTMVARPLTNNAAALEDVFIPAFVKAYQARVEDYRENASAFYRDRHALQTYGAQTLASAFIKTAV